MTYVTRRGTVFMKGIVKKIAIGLVVFITGLAVGSNFREHKEPRFIREFVYIHGRTPNVPRFPRGLHRAVR